MIRSINLLFQDAAPWSVVILLLAALALAAIVAPLARPKPDLRAAAAGLSAVLVLVGGLGALLNFRAALFTMAVVASDVRTSLVWKGLDGAMSCLLITSVCTLLLAMTSVVVGSILARRSLARRGEAS